MRTDLLRALAWRAVVPAAALVALAADVAPAVAGGLSLAGLALAADRLVALRRSGVADRLLVGLGGVLVGVVLTGVVLDLVGVVLSPVSWTAALAVVSLAGLGLAAVVPARDAPLGDQDGQGIGAGGRRAALLALPWAGVAIVVVVVSVRMSAASLSAADAAPVEMSFGQVSGTEVQVVVTSSEAVGPLEVRTSTGDTDISYPLFTVEPDGTATTTVALPLSGRYVITLSYPDQTEPLRTLVLDR